MVALLGGGSDNKQALIQNLEDGGGCPGRWPRHVREGGLRRGACVAKRQSLSHNRRHCSRRRLPFLYTHLAYRWDGDHRATEGSLPVTKSPTYHCDSHTLPARASPVSAHPAGGRCKTCDRTSVTCHRKLYLYRRTARSECAT